MKNKKKSLLKHESDLADFIDLLCHLNLPHTASFSSDDCTSSSGFLSTKASLRLFEKLDDHYISLFLSAPTVLRKHVSYQSTSEDSFDLWQELSSCKIQPSVLIDFLSQTIQTEQNDFGISAASLYVILLKVPGALLHHVYNSSVLNSVISIIDRWAYLTIEFDQHKRKQLLTSDSDVVDRQGGDDSTFVEESTTDASELEQVSTENMMLLLEELSDLCHTFRLKVESDCFFFVLSLFSKLARISSVRAHSKTTQNNVQCAHLSEDGYIDYLNKIEEVSYKALYGLSLYHEGGPSFAVIVKSLLPNLLLSTWNVTKTVPKHAHRVRKQTVNFLIKLAEVHDRKTAFDSLYIFLQHLCHKVPERMEYRQATLNSITEILSYFASARENATIEKFVSFLRTYGADQNPLFRLFALEVIEQILLNGWVQQSNVEVGQADVEELRQSQAGSESNNLTAVLTRFIVLRAYDPIVSVKLRALGVLNNLLQRLLELQSESSEFYRVVFDELLRTPSGDEGRETESDEDGGVVGTGVVRVRATSCIIKLVRRCVRDERASLRKSALALLEIIAKILNLDLPKSDLEVFYHSCFDLFLSIRKQSLISSSQLFERFPNSRWLQRQWIRSVPLLIADSETTVQELSFKYFKTLILERLMVSEADCASPNGEKQLVFSILEELGWGEDSLLDRSLVGLFSYDLQGNTQQNRQSGDVRRFYKRLVRSLVWLSRAKWSNVLVQRGIWMVLHNLSLVSPVVVSGDSLSVEMWEKLKKVSTVYYEKKSHFLAKALSTLSNLAEHLSPDVGRDVEQYLRLNIQSFQCSHDLIAAYVPAYVAFQGVREKRGQGELAFFAQCCKSIEAVLEGVLMESEQSAGVVGAGEEPFDFEHLDRVLFTFGEIVQQFGRSKEYSMRRMTALVQTLVAPSFKKVRKIDQQTGRVMSGEIPAKTRAHAFIALGKLCAQDFQLAKTCLAVFCRELEASPYEVVRNNVSIVLCDLAMRFPNFAEEYIHHVFEGLRDESELVRRQSLLMLTKLVNEDYIKLQRGNHFFKFLLPLVDESEGIRNYAALCLSSLVEKTGSKVENFFFNKFVEVIFVLNDYTLHPKCNQIRYSERERRLFSLTGGDVNRKKRFFVYKFFFDHMLDDQKLQMSFKLCAEVLQEFVDNNLPLENARHVLYDTLCILSSQEIKMKRIKISSDSGEDIQLANVGAHRKLSQARGKLFYGVVKKNIIENIAPTVIQLKYILAQRRSPLLKHVMDYLVNLMVEFKEDMQQLLLTNERLAHELEYEIKQGRSAAMRNMESPWNSQKKKVGTRSIRVRGIPLASAAVAPTPWRGNRGKELGDLSEPPMSVPKLKNANLHLAYASSPARRSISGEFSKVSTGHLTHVSDEGKFDSSSGKPSGTTGVMPFTPKNAGLGLVGLCSPTLHRLRNSAARLNFSLFEASATPFSKAVPFDRPETASGEEVCDNRPPINQEELSCRQVKSKVRVFIPPSPSERRQVKKTRNQSSASTPTEENHLQLAVDCPPSTVALPSPKADFCSIKTTKAVPVRSKRSKRSAVFKKA